MICSWEDVGVESECGKQVVCTVERLCNGGARRWAMRGETGLGGLLN
jgi:hypothetical protein